MQDIKIKSIKATTWSAIDAFSQRGLSFITTMILARILTPVDYGIIGMLAIFIGLTTAFIESGFPLALIQSRDITETDISSVFYFNIAMGLLCGFLLCLLAPWIAKFYSMPVLKPLVWFVAVSLFIGSFGSVQNALLTKELDFKKISVISIVSTSISGVVALILAWKQFGVWSLAIQIAVATLISTVLLWLLSSWRPRLVFSVQSIRSLSRFSVYILFFVLVDVLYTRLNTIIIGRWYSAKDLGYYTRADQTQQLPGGFIIRIIGRVAFPIFAAEKENSARLKAGLRKATTAVMMINIPLMFGLIVTSRSLVLLLFGPQWAPCVQYLQILSLGGCLLPLHFLNMNIIAAQGNSDILFRLNLINKTVGIILIGTACFFSITMIAWSTVVSGIFCFFINAHYTRIFFDYGASKQALDILPYFFASLLMACCAWAVTLLPVNSAFALVAIQVSIGLIVYCLYCYLFRLRAFIEVLKIIRGYSFPYLGLGNDK